MLTVTNLTGFSAKIAPKLFYDILLDAGQLASLNLCLDAGDIRSTDGSSQTWTDLSGTANFVRGATGSAGADDPTFNGTAGSANDTTYWSFDGGDQFTSGNVTYPDAWLKDNGAASFACVIQRVAGTNQTLYDLDPGTNNFSWYISNNQLFLIRAYNNVNAQDNLGITLTAFTTGQYHFLAGTYNEATTTQRAWLNDGADSTKTGTATTTASTRTNNRATQPTYIGTNTVSSLLNGTRLYCFASWSRTLSTTDLTAIYTRLKTSRFTALP